MPKSAWILAFLALSAGMAAQQQPPPDGDEAAGVNSFQPRSDSNGVYFPGRGVTGPLIIERAQVEYPTTNVPTSDIEGTTILKLVVSREGVATDIQVVSSHGDAFDQASMHAIQQCRFAPGRLNGDPVPVHVFARVRFFEDMRETYPRLLLRYMPNLDLGASAARNYDKPPVATYIAPAVYSEKARKAKYQGVAVVSALISEEGVPTDVKVVRSLGMGLDDKAIESVRRSRFQPATKDGVPVAAQITIEVSFRLY